MCEICKHSPCVSGCPNYSPEKTSQKCDLCGEYICVGEEYVDNFEGDLAHFECLGCSDSDLNWLGY